MTNLASALRPVSSSELEDLRPLLAAAGADRPAATLRNADLVADLRRARAVRFADRYEWLALRRRRAQIAARRALAVPSSPLVTNLQRPLRDRGRTAR